MADLPIKVSCECYMALKEIREKYGKTKKFAVEEALKEKYPELFGKEKTNNEQLR